MFGGCGGTGKEMSFGDINKYDLKNKIWTKLEALGKAPSPRAAHAATVISNERMLVHGGIDIDSENFDDTYILSGLNMQIDRYQSEMYSWQAREDKELKR